MDARSAARMAAVQAIFEKDLNEEAIADAKFLGSTFDQKKINKGVFNKVIDGFENNKEEVDEAISQNLSEKWKFERLTGILKAILRCGVAELKFTDSPKNVVLSEYIEIADNFVEENEVRFVNALLDKIN